MSLHWEEVPKRIRERQRKQGSVTVATMIVDISF